VSFVRRIAALRESANFLSIARQSPDAAAQVKRDHLAHEQGASWRGWVVRVLLFLPSILALIYFGFIASDQYESEAKFIVRSSVRSEGLGGFASLLQIGLGRSRDDAFAVEEFITSRGAIAALKNEMPIEAMYGLKGADIVARFPGLIYSDSAEQFHRYFNRMVTVLHSHSTDVTTLSVRAFRAEDSLRITQSLLRHGEELINRMNDRIQKDTIKVSLDQLEQSYARLVHARLELTNFRNKELVIDPVANAVTLSELIGKLSSELAQTRAKLAELGATSPASPQITMLRQRGAALEQQIASERGRISNRSDGLADRMATYERLSLDREFAQKMVEAAEKDVGRAKLEAQRQHLYLERVVEPQLADYPLFPERLANTLTVFVGNLILALVAWLVFSGIREHGSQAG
jgi:capsular polysaccharide transport system permease protein